MRRIVILILIGAILGTVLAYFIVLFFGGSTSVSYVALLIPILSCVPIGISWNRSRSRQLLRYIESKRAAGFEKLPVSVTDFIAEVINKMGYRRVRRDVELELISYFNDAINDCNTDGEKDARGQTLIEQFGEPRFLAKLIRRAKKRCRPIWKKTLIRTAQATAALFLFLCLYTWWFVTGKPNIAIDYVARLNQMVRPEAPDDQNAWPYYQKAIDQYAEPNEPFNEMFVSIREPKGHVSFASLSIPEQEAMRNWFVQNEPAWAHFLAASKMKHLWYNYQTFDETDSRYQGELLVVRFPPLKKFRDLCKLGLWQVRLLYENGEIQKAVDQCLAVIRAGRHFQPSPSLLEQLFAQFIGNMGHGEILNIIRNTKLSAMQLASVQKQLMVVNQDGYPMMNFDYERLLSLDVVQRYFTDGGPGGGHLLLNFERVFLFTGSGNPVHKWDMMPKNASVVTHGLIHAGRHDTLNKLNTLFDMYLKKEIHLTPWQKHVSNNPTTEDYVNSLPRARYFLVQSIEPMFVRASEKVWQGRALHEATLTILVLHRWKLQKGSFPDSLDELIDADLLKKLPADPYSDGPLTYKKQGNDFILYSYAGDFDDDQGRQNPDQHPRAWNEENGDRLFWPLETPTPSSTDL